MSRRLNISRVAVIGAGPSGLAAAKYLTAEKHFARIDVFEQRSCVGGLWNYTPDYRSEKTFSIPLTDPHVPPEEPIWESMKDLSNGHHGLSSNQDQSAVPAFVSPIYERLETNLPKQLMRFSDLPFSNDLPLFPTHRDVKSYIQHFARDVLHLIQFEVQVEKVVPRQSTDGHETWQVTTKNLRNGDVQKKEYDGVIVANGHFNTPFIPSIPGLAEWAETYPASITHSKYYRRPEEFENKKTVVIGTSSSGSDIAHQIRRYAKSPLLVSARTMPTNLADDSQDLLTYPSILEVDPKTRTVRFQDGHEETGVDSLVFCTGYLYSFPFLPPLDPPLLTSGLRLENTFEYLLYAPRPSLAMLGMPIKIVPFPVAESQSAVVARLFSGRLDVPRYETMRDWEEKTLQVMGDGSKFHTLTFPKDWFYMNMLLDWADQADPQEGVGKSPRAWGSWEGWAMKNFLAIRQAFKQKGKNRTNVKCSDELDLDLDDTPQEIPSLDGTRSAELMRATGSP